MELDNNKPTVIELVEEICKIEPSYRGKRSALFNKYKKKNLKKLLERLKEKYGKN